MSLVGFRKCANKKETLWLVPFSFLCFFVLFELELMSSYLNTGHSGTPSSRELLVHNRRSGPILDAPFASVNLIGKLDSRAQLIHSNDIIIPLFLTLKSFACLVEILQF